MSDLDKRAIERALLDLGATKTPVDVDRVMREKGDLLTAALLNSVESGILALQITNESKGGELIRNSTFYISDTLERGKFHFNLHAKICLATTLNKISVCNGCDSSVKNEKGEPQVCKRYEIAGQCDKECYTSRIQSSGEIISRQMPPSLARNTHSRISMTEKGINMIGEKSRLMRGG